MNLLTPPYKNSIYNGSKNRKIISKNYYLQSNKNALNKTKRLQVYARALVYVANTLHTIFAKLHRQLSISSFLNLLLKAGRVQDQFLDLRS